MSIEIHNLFLSLGHKTILDDVSTKFCTGELTIILGPNGTGKSSLLKIISQEWKARGSISVYGKPASHWHSEELASFMGVLPQSSSLTFAFTVREVVELGGLGLKASQRQIQEIATSNMLKTDVVHLADRLYPSLSGGEKQRVHLARVLTQLAQAPKDPLLLLDEPTSALDLAHQHNTLNIASNMAKQGAAVIAVIHDLNLAAQYGDRIMMLNGGRIVADGTPEEVITGSNIEAVYDWPVNVMPHPEHGHPVVFG